MVDVGLELNVYLVIRFGLEYFYLLSNGDKCYVEQGYVFGQEPSDGEYMFVAIITAT